MLDPQLATFSRRWIDYFTRNTKLELLDRDPAYKAKIQAMQDRFTEQIVSSAQAGQFNVDNEAWEKAVKQHDEEMEQYVLSQLPSVFSSPHSVNPPNS